MDHAHLLPLGGVHLEALVRAGVADGNGGKWAGALDKM